MTFPELSNQQLYRILAARSAVFVVEQLCAYQDIDGKDENAMHLIGWGPDGEVLAYARLLAPGASYEGASFGRVLTSDVARGCGLGRALIERAIAACREYYPTSAIEIGAQCYLERFYREFGFVACSEPYDEDGIPHLDMRLPAKA
ncbi:GNAT family N-acetyltransferase [Biformimicrobium ophioploci]|uniref:GNAT family N-acetyltransferase n=1 Tax=Biformimicrobium ophioploci TaxID=3036711 RepID=UPI002556F7F7|nr:GNAT family N-acetyltransferase [Microbulbifer sp. NKW57]